MSATVSQADYKVPGKAWAILWAMGFGALIAQMFSTVIGPALPTIQDELGLSLSAATWTITAYSLAFGTALVAGGRMGDLVGEVKMIVWGFVIFGIGLVMSAIATGGALLISGRAIQGIGIGLSAPATLSIVVNSFPAFKRGFAVGIWGFAHGFGLLIGPIVAGYLTQYINWRWMFWIAIPFTVGVIFITLAATRGYESVIAKGTYDFVGLILGGAAITLVTYGLQNAAESWTQPATTVPIGLSVVLFIAFAFAEMRIKHPLVDFSLWKERLFSGGFFAEAATGFVYIPMLTFIGSLFFITVLDFSPVKASWVIVITTATCMVLEPPAGRVVDRIGPGIPITFSLLLQAGSLFWMFLAFDQNTSLAAMIIPLAMMGAGVGIALPACNTAAMSAVDAERAGMGSGLIQMTFNIPAALGAAVVTSIIGTVTLSHIQGNISNPEFNDVASTYAQQTLRGETEAATQTLANLPADVAENIKQAAIQADALGITTAMGVLGLVALAGAIMAWFVIGRRKTPDHIQTTHAAEL